MKNILILDAGLKSAWTSRAADTIAAELSRSGEYNVDRINLRDERIEPCVGCALCLDRGEEKCRSHADATIGILDRMCSADGIVTVTPNYSLQVPWTLKLLYDRLAFVFHRPRLFHKASLTVVVQGVYGGGKIVRYIDELMTFWGCNTVKGAVISGALYPNGKMNATVRDRNGEKLVQAVRRFEKELRRTRPKHPSLFRTILLRATRSSMKHSPDSLPADKAWYQGNGWFESGYYYKVRLSPLHGLAGAVMDRMMKGMFKKDILRQAGESDRG